MPSDNKKKQASFVENADVATTQKKDQIIGAMKRLLAEQNGSLTDKIVTVKTANVVDKSRFEAAFRTLMKR